MQDIPHDSSVPTAVFPPDPPAGAPKAPDLATWTTWCGVAAMALALFMMSTDLTVLFIAQPAIAADLRPDAAQALWIVHVGEFLAASLVITMGRLGDLVGRRRLLLLGMTGYGLASLLAAFAPSPEVLILARAALGVSLATVTPSAMALLRTMFPNPRQFSTAFALLMMSLSVGAALGPPMGGFLLQHFWWGSVFLVNVPVAVVFLLVAVRSLPEFRDRGAGRLDLPSIALSVIAVIGVVYGLQQAADGGFEVHHLIAVAVGLIAGWLFVRRQRRLKDPLLELGLLDARQVRVTLAALVLVGLAFAGPDVLIGPYLQIGLGLSALHTGLLLSVPAAVLIPATLIAPLLGRRLGTVRAVTASLVTAVAGFGLAGLGLIGGSGPGVLALLILGLALAALIGVAFTLLSELLVTSAPIQRTGSMTALQDLGTGIGAASGIAVLGSLGAIAYRANLSVSEAMSSSDAAAAGASPGAAVEIADRLDAAARAELLASIASSMSLGLQVALITTAVITIAAIALLRLGLREPATPPTTAEGDARVF